MKRHPRLLFWAVRLTDGSVKTGKHYGSATFTQYCKILQRKFRDWNCVSVGVDERAYDVN